MRLVVCLFLLITLIGAISGCSKRQGSVEGHVENLGMTDQSEIYVQMTESGVIVAEALTDGHGNYDIPQIEPGDYEVYLKYGDPGPGTPDTLKSSMRVRWRRSAAVQFFVEGGLIAEPDDLIRYTLYQARAASYDTFSGFVFEKAANKESPFVSASSAADFFVERNGSTGVSFGTLGYASILDAGADSLGVGSPVPAGGFQETYSYSPASDCIGKNYVIKCRNGKYAKLHILDAGVDSPTGDTLDYGYVTFLSFYMLTDSTHFPAIPPD
jgi:hypothetical protein